MSILHGDGDGDVTCSNVEIIASERMKCAFSRSNWARRPFFTLSPPSRHDLYDLMTRMMIFDHTYDDDKMLVILFLPLL